MATLKKVKKISEGYYVSETFLQIIKELKVKTVKDINGVARKTQGTWTGKDNFLTFRPGVKMYLNADLLALPQVESLIREGKIRQTF